MELAAAESELTTTQQDLLVLTAHAQILEAVLALTNTGADTQGCAVCASLRAVIANLNAQIANLQKQVDLQKKIISKQNLLIQMLENIVEWYQLTYGSYNP